MWHKRASQRSGNRSGGSEGRLVAAKAAGVGVGVSRCKLVYMEKINSKVPLHSAGNSIQYPG